MLPQDYGADAWWTRAGIGRLLGFRPKPPAVSNLSLRFPFGQITSLLGSNGAGKSTTLSILCGLFPQTSGSVQVHGYDTRKSIDLARKHLGVCPQYNALFEALTVREHIALCARIRQNDTTLVERALDDSLVLIKVPFGLPCVRACVRVWLGVGVYVSVSVSVPVCAPVCACLCLCLCACLSVSVFLSVCLRTVSTPHYGHVCVRVCQALGLQPYLDYQCRHLSGGNKRKLSVALAFVCSPPIIILDEPTAVSALHAPFSFRHAATKSISFFPCSCLCF